jgi:putative ABC transport system permease protein
MWNVALKTLLSDRGKLLTALVGVVFSVVLVNVQGGLFVGLIRKASLLVDNGRADIWIGHKKMHNVDFPRDIPRRWLDRVRAVPGVHQAEAYIVGHSVMTLPSGGFEPVVVVGCDPATMLGNAWRIADGRADDILQPDGVIVDLCDADKIGDPRVGDLREIGGRRARIVARSEGILGFLVTPYVFTTLDRAAAYADKPADQCSYLMVRLEDGESAAQICRRIAEALPDAEVCTRDEYAQRSIDYWMKRTGLGISFGAATLLGLLVGLVIVAQTLYASVLDRLSEYAAMKAIGASDRQIITLLSSQAVTMAVVGSLIGLILVFAGQGLLSDPRAPIVVPWWLSIGSFALVLSICLVAAAAPYLRIRRLDPAIVLQT